MTVAQIITAYIQVCAKFGLFLQISDGVLYVYGKHGRLGYITKNLYRAGHGGEIANAHGLLFDICRKHNLKVDFHSPGEFIAYTDTQFGIVPMPQREPEPIILPATPASDMQTVAYAI